MKLLLENWREFLKEDTEPYPYQIYCDMDGVLVDFLAGAIKKMNETIEDIIKTLPDDSYIKNYDEDEGWGDDDDDGTDDTTQDDNDDDDPTTGDDDTADDTADDDDPTGVDKDKLLADLEKKYEKYNETDYNELFDAEF